MATVAVFIADLGRSKERLKDDNVAPRERAGKASMLDEIIGASAGLRSVLSRVAKVAPTDANRPRHWRNGNWQRACCTRHTSKIRSCFASVR